MVVPALRRAYAKYNNGNGLTPNDKSNITDQMTQLASFIDTVPIPSPDIFQPTKSVSSSVPSGWSSKVLANGLTNSRPLNVQLVTLAGAFSVANVVNQYNSAQAIFISDNRTFAAAYTPDTGSSRINLDTSTTSGTLTTLPGILYYNPNYFSVS
jgi:hypothetical protein